MKTTRRRGVEEGVEEDEEDEGDTEKGADKEGSRGLMHWGRGQIRVGGPG